LLLRRRQWRQRRRRRLRHKHRPRASLGGHSTASCEAFFCGCPGRKGQRPGLEMMRVCLAFGGVFAVFYCIIYSFSTVAKNEGCSRRFCLFYFQRFLLFLFLRMQSGKTDMFVFENEWVGHFLFAADLSLVCLRNWRRLLLLPLFFRGNSVCEIVGFYLIDSELFGQNTEIEVNGYGNLSSLSLCFDICNVM